MSARAREAARADISAGRSVRPDGANGAGASPASVRLQAIAHDYHNRLAVVLGNLQLLDRRLGDDPVAAPLLSAAAEAAQGASDLTRELFAAPGARGTGARRRVNVNELLARLRGRLEGLHFGRLRIRLEPDPDARAVETEPARLEDAIVNLVLNARDAMPTGGTVTIRTRARHVAEPAATAPGPYVEIEVCDTGCGMSRECRERAFDPFFTTKAPGPGTGIGLSSVHDYAHAAGGGVTIESQVGAGTRVRIVLPAAPPSALPAPEAARAAAV